MSARLITVSASFTRPSDTTAYASADLVANSTTAGSVVAMSFELQATAGILTSLTLRKTKADVSNANFRVWLLNASPTVTNGDNGGFAGDFLSSVICEPIDCNTDALLTGGGAIGSAYFEGRQIKLPARVYALIEARGAYTPASAEVFTLGLTAEQI